MVAAIIHAARATQGRLGYVVLVRRLTRARRGGARAGRKRLTPEGLMRFLSAWLPLGRVLAAIDLLLIVWTIAWILVGVRVANEVEGLTSLSDTVVQAGGSIQAAGAALGAVSDLPVVGDRVRAPADQLRQTGASTAESGRKSRDSIHSLSSLLGFTIALIPTVPLLALYVPLRVAALRERRAVEDLLRAHAGDPRLPRLLAQRALARLPYRDLAGATLRAPHAATNGSTQPLAEAELERVGLDPERLQS
jgi:hypothetical protein